MITPRTFWMKTGVLLVLALSTTLAWSRVAQADEPSEREIVKEKRVMVCTDAGGAGGSAFLGVVPRPLDHVLRAALEYEEPGILLAEVVPDGPAAKAGLRVGDVLTKLGGKPVHDVDRLHALLREAKPGQQLEAVAAHGGKTRKLTITVGERPSPTCTDLPFNINGMEWLPGACGSSGSGPVDIRLEGVDEKDGETRVRIIRTEAGADK